MIAIVRTNIMRFGYVLVYKIPILSKCVERDLHERFFVHSTKSLSHKQFVFGEQFFTSVVSCVYYLGYI